MSAFLPYPHQRATIAALRARGLDVGDVAIDVQAPDPRTFVVTGIGCAEQYRSYVRHLAAATDPPLCALTSYSLDNVIYRYEPRNFEMAIPDLSDYAPRNRTERRRRQKTGDRAERQKKTYPHPTGGTYR